MKCEDIHTSNICEPVDTKGVFMREKQSPSSSWAACILVNTFFFLCVYSVMSVILLMKLNHLANCVLGQAY